MTNMLNLVSGASYKEVPFMVDSHTMTGGRKDVLHKYVNSDKQKIEDLGLMRRSISITAVISGSGYFIDRDELLAALEEGGSGTLVHPFFGNMENMVARSYTLNESFGQFGEARFSIKFDYSSPEVAGPEIDLSSIAQVQLKSEIARLETELSLAEGYKPPTFIDEYNAAKEKFAGFIGEINDAAQISNGVVSEINDFNSQISSFSGGLVSLLGSPADIASSVDSLFVTATNVFDAPRQSLESMLEMFGFGSGDKDQLKFSTETLNNINSNNDVVNTSINAYALIQSYEFFVQTDFSTIDELSYYEDIIETQYQSVINSGIAVESNISNVEIESLSRDAKSALTTLRTVTSEVVSILKTTLPNIIEIEVPSTVPLRALEYQYYGNNDQSSSIRELNSNPNESFVSGKLEIINNVNSSS